MKRTKEKTEKNDEEEVRSRMYDGEVSGAMREGAARIMVEPSYVNIENLRFGILASKGEKYSIDADSVFIHNFFAQVKAETD